ncbi:hypothetical protein [Singulisphaera sp. PoT]|uniref:hypothetical protein n=1 Tax=Singulisphaera sp. PoT TaxID=3411797 RepID=UPI003BF4C872
MIGPSPSERGLPAVPADAAWHAVQTTREWREVAASYVERRMGELGIPCGKIGADDPRAGKPWGVFDPEEKTGGSISTGIVIDSGVLNPDLLGGKKGGRLWWAANLRDGIDAIIAHEWAEDRTLGHDAALEEAARTALPVTEGARRILKVMAR